jgi:hypothetical protein
MHLEVPPDTQSGSQDFCRRIPPSLRKGFPALQLVNDTELSYSSRKRRIRRRTVAYIAGVTRPVCVFCWLGW